MSVATEPGVIVAAPAAQTTGDTAWRLGLVWRDIARGGIAGLIVGVLVVGLGGRLAMRLAAIIVPEAAGAFTENGNRIGDITLAGTLALIVFVGLPFGAVAGTVWVVVRPWIPGAVIVRALLTSVVAIATGTFALISGDNSDFIVVRHDPLVVAVLVALVGLVGFAISLVDEWLDRRLPPAVAATTGPTLVYASISLVGAILFLPIVVAAYLTSDMRLTGLGLIVVGLATLQWWRLRRAAHDRPPRRLALVARLALAAAVMAGLVAEVPEIAGALGA